MRIAMVSAHYQLLDGRIFHREARALARAGHEVVLVHWDRTRDGAPERLKIDGIATVSIPIDIHSDRSVLLKAIAFRGIRRRIAGAVVAEKPDAVHCHDLETLPIGIEVKDRLGVPLVYDAHEDYPAMVAMTSPVTAKAFARMETGGLRKVDRVITVNEILAEKYGRSRPCTVVANYPELAAFRRDDPRWQALDRSPFREATRKGHVAAIYAGGISRTRGLVELLDAMRSAMNVEAAVVGRTLDDLDVGKEALERNLHLRTHVLDEVPFDRVPGYLFAADIGYAVLNPTKSNAQATPVKLFEYLAAGLPVLANADFPVSRAVLRKWECGLGVRCDPKEIADALDRLARDPDLRRSMGERGRAAVAAEYNWESQAEHLLQVYAGLAEGS